MSYPQRDPDEHYEPISLRQSVSEWAFTHPLPEEYDGTEYDDRGSKPVRPDVDRAESEAGR